MFRLTFSPILLPLLAGLLLPMLAPADVTPPAPGTTPAPATAGPSAPSAPSVVEGAPSAKVPDPPRSPGPGPAPAPVKDSANPPSTPEPAAGSALPAPAPSDKIPLLPAAAPASPDEAFARALKAYNAGAIEEARQEFLAIVESGKLSAPLAHNLGNIEFRRGNPGQAVLWYKRALALQPFSPETLQNLRTLRRQTGFLSFDRWGLSLSHVKSRWIENGTVLTAWLTGLVLVWLAWLTPRRGLRWPLVTLLGLLFPVLAAGAFLTWRLRSDAHPLVKRHIVSGKETSAYAAPAEASSSVMSLPSGSEVVPLETRGNWLYCIIPGGDEDQPLRGWIRSAKLEPLWPWAATL